MRGVIVATRRVFSSEGTADYVASVIGHLSDARAGFIFIRNVV